MVVSRDRREDAAMHQGNGSISGDVHADWLSRGPEGQALNLDLAQRDWIFPGVDEYFRAIYTRAGLGFSSEVVAVCSSIAGEGKTTTTVGLGVTLAQDFPDTRVLIVETDLSNAVLASDFEVAPNPGLVDCVFANAPIQDAYRATFLDNLHLVPVGGPLQGGGRILRSIRIASAVESMRKTHDVVIIDVPAILVNSDAVLLTDLADGIIFVARAGVTPLDVINKGVSQLDAEKLRGMVLNGADSSVPGWIRRLWAE